MLFRVTAFLYLVASMASGEMMIPKGSISAASKAGSRLLSKARALNEERDVTWVANYDIKYTGCSSLVQIREEGGGDEGLIYTQNLAKFSLCPSDDSCGKCENGAHYVVNMMEFLDAYTEFKMDEQERICENIRENCYCNGNNDEDACENQCYQNEGMDVCIEYEGQEEFEIQRYLECQEMQENNNGNNYNGNQDNWYGQYFIGPYCAEEDGWSIHLGVFYDEGCSARADSSAYANRNYGAALPFSQDPIVTNECISCMEVDEDNNNNNNNNNNGNNQELQANELCDGLYEQAARCEKNLNIQYPDTTSCTYIESVLPKLEHATRQVTSRNSSSGGGTAKALSWIFGVTTIVFGVYAFWLHGKATRSKVNLSGSGGALA